MRAFTFTADEMAVLALIRAAGLLGVEEDVEVLGVGDDGSESCDLVRRELHLVLQEVRLTLQVVTGRVVSADYVASEEVAGAHAGPKGGDLLSEARRLLFEQSHPMLHLFHLANPIAVAPASAESASDGKADRSIADVEAMP